MLGKVKDYDLDNEVKNPLLSDPVMAKFRPADIEKSIAAAKANMEGAAKELDFLRAAKFRDEMNALKRLLESK